VGQQSTGSLNAGSGRGPCPCFLLTNIGIARLQDIFLLNDCAGCGGDLLLGTWDVLMELITLLLLPEIAHQCVPSVYRLRLAAVYCARTSMVAVSCGLFVA
jgi:hypothetical protein